MNKNRTTTKSTNVSWKVIENRDILVDSRLRVSVQRLKLPNGKIIEDYYRIDSPEAVIIVAHTVNGKVVMSRQYQHGFGRVSVVLPSGTIEKEESPLQTAQRELLEETGYLSNEWQSLGNHVLHNNYGFCKVHFFFADNAKQTAKPHSGDLEEMEIILMDEHEIINAIKKQDIISMGTITALSLAKAILDDALF